MKYNNPIYKNTSKNKKKTYLIYVFILFLAYTVGSWSERYNYKNNIIFFFNDIAENLISKFLINSSKTEKLFLNIKLKDYDYLTKERNKRLLNNNSTSDNEKWSNTEVVYNKKKYNSKIKLKGQLADHWTHEKKWSFKIKINDKGNIKSLKRFTLQYPGTLDYLNEWLFVKALKKEGLIELKTDFVELVVNGESFGIYTLQESLTKNTLERNQRTEGALIGFNSDLWLNEVLNFNNLSVNSSEQSYFRAKIEPVRYKIDNTSQLQEELLQKAIFLLESFRNGLLETSEVFDTNQLSKALAIKAIFSSVEFDWADINFYYNPVTSLLEPIMKEVHTIQEYEAHHYNWWFDSYALIEKPNNQNYFLKQIYKDKNFYAKYLNELNNFSKLKYIEELINENKKEYNYYFSLLKKHFPNKVILGNQKNNIFEKQKKKISDTLNPIQGINAYYIDFKNNSLVLNVSNLQKVPVQIIGLINSEKKYLYLKEPFLIEGYKSTKKPPKKNIMKVKCENKNKFCDQINLDKVKLIYKLVSQNVNKFSTIEKFYFKEERNTNTNKSSIDSLDFVTYDDLKKTYTFKEGLWKIKKDIVFSKGKKVIISPGTKLEFFNGSQIISYSPIFLLGTAQKPIYLSKSKEKTNSYPALSGGILVINANSESLIDNVFFEGLSTSDNISKHNVKGAVTFYNSDVKIFNSVFSGNIYGDDYINIINSKFSLKNIEIYDSIFDSIDIDFSDGNINGVKIINPGNDALDFSTSKVTVENTHIINSGDKAISAGENSEINLKKIIIDQSKIGIASKDSSKVIGEEIQILNTQIALTSYIKKDIYESPVITIFNSKIENSEIQFLSEENFKISYNGVEQEKTQFDFSSL